MSLYMCARANFNLEEISVPTFIPKDAVPNDIQTAIIGVEDPTFLIHNGYAKTDTLDRCYNIPKGGEKHVLITASK